MAGNKTLDKFKDSKIPKKGTGTTNEEVKIYAEPNTNSKVIGIVKKDEVIDWISKSICDEKEWVRCGQKNNFGYIIGNNADGTCNLKEDTIQEKKEEKIAKNFQILQNLNECQITKEENEIANEVLKEILEEDDDKKDDDNENNENISNSTEANNNSSHNDIFDNLDDNLNKPFDVNSNEIFKDNLDNFYYDGDVSNLDGVIKEEQNLETNLLNMMKTDKEQNNNISKALNSIKDIFPKQDNSSDSNYEDLLLNMLDSIPRGKKKDNFMEKGTSIVDATANQLIKEKGTVRLTSGKYKGDNFSPKYYVNGWNGGSRAGIKTIKMSEIGKIIKVKTGPINNAISLINVGKAIIEDEGKIGDKTKEAIVCEVGSKIGETTGGIIAKNVGKVLVNTISLLPPVRGIKTIYTIAKMVGAVYLTLKCSDIGKDVAKKIMDKKDESEDEKGKNEKKENKK